MLFYYLATTLTLEKLPVHLRLALVFIKLIYCVVLADYLYRSFSQYRSIKNFTCISEWQQYDLKVIFSFVGPSFQFFIFQIPFLIHTNSPLFCCNSLLCKSLHSWIGFRIFNDKKEVIILSYPLPDLSKYLIVNWLKRYICSWTDK